MSVPDQLRAELKQALVSHAEQLAGPEARQRSLPREGRRLPRLVPSSAVALLAVTVAVLAFTSRGATPPPASAATVLHAAAAAAQRSGTALRLGAHSYLYERTIERSRFLDPAGDTLLHALDESWTARNGAGRELITVLNPSAVRHVSRVNGGPFRQHPSPRPFTLVSGVALSYRQLQHLPSSPARLQTFVDRLADRSGRAFREWSRSGRSMMVLYMLRSLALAPAPNTTRAAVYRVMASTPGIKLVGHRRDTLGRAGELLTATLGPEEAELIINPDSGRLLQFTRILLHRSPLYPGWRPGLVARDTYVDEAIVGSATARPHLGGNAASAEATR